MDLKDIKAIVDLMKKNSISEFEMEKEGFKLRLKRLGNGSSGVPQSEEYSPANVPTVPANPIASLGPANLPMTSSLLPAELEIKAPMVGTFYRAPSPESASYIEVGSELNLDTVVCIIEAMKVMNEIKAELRGVVTQVLAENGKPVEFGQPLFKVRPL